MHVERAADALRRSNGDLAHTTLDLV